ncbi:MAG TPA: EamA family transporter [Ignavibacteriaceae bacterium]|nr:EamA family transporter [Ignavibacteriaceae bacterium]
MHFLFLTILCSTSIALILKYSDTKKGEPIVLLAGNYLVASLIGLILLILNDEKIFSIQTLIFGTGLGLLFVLSFFVYAKAISYAGTGLATTSARLSVIIPILLSIIIFNELPNQLHLFGFLFTVITFILFYYSVKGNHRDGEGVLKYFFLIAVFIGIGINDFAIKVFKSWRSEQEEPYFVFIIFASAFIYSAIYIIIRKVKVVKQTALWGLVLGVPNVFSTVFLLAALSMLPAILVYPFMNIGIIVLTTVMAFLIWKEKLDRWGVFALASGLLAILFLSLGG